MQHYATKSVSEFLSVMCSFFALQFQKKGNIASRDMETGCDGDGNRINSFR